MTKVKELNIIEKLKAEENSVFGFRNVYEFPTYKEGLYLLVQANSMAFCEPQEDVDLDKYTSLQVQFKHKNSEDFITVEQAKEYLDEISEVDSLNDYLVNDMFVRNTYGNVPIELVDEIYKKVTEKPKSKPEPKKENEEVKKTTKKTTKTTKTTTKRKITKKQAVKVVNEVITALNSKFFEMDEEVHSLIIGLLAKEHILMVGLPGIAKSDLAMQFSEITGGTHFGIQLQQTTTPDEVFGGINHEEYIKGNVERNVKGTMLESNFAYLDEIFKSNSAILNHLLQVLNERTYDNGGKIDVPLISAVGASNEFPHEEELSALYDRFLIRHYVTPVKDRGNYIKMLKGEGKDIKIPQIAFDDLLTIHDMVEKITVPDNIYGSIYDLIKEIIDEGIYVSPRRSKKSIKLLQANAFIEGRSEVEKADLTVLKHVFWNEYEEKDIVTNIVERMSLDQTIFKLNNYKKEVNELYSKFNSLDSSDNIKDSAMEYGAKIKEIKLSVQNLIAESESKKNTDEINKVFNEIKEIEEKLFNQAISKI